MTKKSPKRKNTVVSITSFYALKATANDGTVITFEQFKGKNIMLVNTASDCGFTGQYEELEKLYQQYKHSLVVMAFPSNDFKEQEKMDDDSIASFCKLNYGISFPLMKKSVVIKTAGQQAVFEWLSHKDKNGWNDESPKWNFYKFLVNETGNLTHIFPSATAPLSDEVINAVKK